MNFEALSKVCKACPGLTDKELADSIRDVEAIIAGLKALGPKYRLAVIVLYAELTMLENFRDARAR